MDCITDNQRRHSFYLISTFSHSVYYMRCPEKEDSENLAEEGISIWNNRIIRLYSAWNRAVEEKVTFFLVFIYNSLKILKYN